MKNIQGLLAATTSAAARKSGESIHSGQFMVSHIENNDEEEDVERDKIIELLTEDESSASGVTGGGSCAGASGIGITPSGVPPVVMPCTDLQIYNPSTAANRAASDHLGHIIDTDLSTVFNTLNVTYT